MLTEHLCFLLRYVVKQILSGMAREVILENIHAKLMEVSEQVKEGKLEIALYEITKVNDFTVSMSSEDRRIRYNIFQFSLSLYEFWYITCSHLQSLTKNPEDYPDKKSLPHVQVAMRMNSKGGKKMRSGDTVYYVVCEVYD